MITLEPLCTMTLRVNTPRDAGSAPTGRRIVSELVGAELTGRLSGQMVGTSSADWFTWTTTGVGLPDVRLAIETHDGALVLIRYFGRVRLVPDEASIALVAPVFETGDDRYLWLNDVQAVGKGIFNADRTQLNYEIYELG